MAVNKTVKRISEEQALQDYFPSQEWLHIVEDKNNYHVRSLKPGRHMRALLVANNLGDHLVPPRLPLNGVADRIHVVVERLAEAGFEVHVLPLGALLRLDADEKKLFFQSLDRYFSLAVHMGGADITPSLYGEQARAENGAMGFNETVDRIELETLRGVLQNTRMNILGISRGAQLLAVGAGCKLHQDIYHDLNVEESHRDQRAHPVVVLPDKTNPLISLFALSEQNRNSEGQYEFDAPSVHHQSVNLDRPNPKLVIRAVSKSGDANVVEAFQLLQRGKRLALGVQFHPEYAEDSHNLNIFSALADECQNLLRRKSR